MSQDNNELHQWLEERVIREAATKDAEANAYNPPPSENMRTIYDRVYQETVKSRQEKYPNTTKIKAEDRSNVDGITKFQTIYLILTALSNPIVRVILGAFVIILLLSLGDLYFKVRSSWNRP